MLTRRPGMLRKGFKDILKKYGKGADEFHHRLIKGMEPSTTSVESSSAPPPDSQAPSAPKLTDLHPKKPTAVFLMGLPASGKSSMIQKYFGNHIDGGRIHLLDADKFKKQHPDYNPEEAFKVHDWSLERLGDAWGDALSSGRNAILDGTGTTPERTISRIGEAKKAGYHTKLMHVTVPLETSLERMSKRKRKVPEHVVKKMSDTVHDAYKQTSPYVDEVHIVDNSKFDPRFAGKLD